MLAYVHQEVEALCQSLRNNTTLLELRAGGRQLDAAGAAAFACMLTANCTLRLLCIGSTDFGNDAAAKLAEGLARNTALRELDLGGPRGITGHGAAALAQAIHVQSQSLVVSGTDDAAEDDSRPTSSAANDMGGLRVLDLSRNAIGDTGVCSLANVASSLMSLTLSACGADSLAAAALGRAASCKASRLLHLDLSLNKLGPGGASALATGLTSGGHAVLETLNLADTDVVDEGAVEVLAAAAQLPSLRRLDLSRCGLNGDGLAHLDGADVLNALTTLVLADNDLNSNGIAALMGCCPEIKSAILSGELILQHSGCNSSRGERYILRSMCAHTRTATAAQPRT